MFRSQCFSEPRHSRVASAVRDCCYPILSLSDTQQHCFQSLNNFSSIKLPKVFTHKNNLETFIQPDWTSGIVRRLCRRPTPCIAAVCSASDRSAIARTGCELRVRSQHAVSPGAGNAGFSLALNCRLPSADSRYRAGKNSQTTSVRSFMFWLTGMRENGSRSPLQSKERVVVRASGRQGTRWRLDKDEWSLPLKGSIFTPAVSRKMLTKLNAFN